MSVIRTDKNNNEATLALNIVKSDYEPKLSEELKKYQQKAQMKGFRKGKVPKSVIRKMYGKAMLADVINALIQEKLGGYIESEKLDLLGQPLPSKEQKIYDFNLDNSGDFTFLFDVGLSPVLELTGVAAETVFKRPKVEVTHEMIDKDLQAARKRYGQEVHPEKDFRDDDRLLLNAKELEGDVLKNDGFETSFQILISNIADQSLRDQVKKMLKEDTFRFNIYELEPDRSEDYVKKYLLNLAKEDMDRETGQMFEATISEVNRIDPAELNEAFFGQAFGEGAVSSEDEARAKVKEQIEAFYDRQAEALMFRDFQEKLLEINQVTLPDEFLKRWLVASNDNLQEKQLTHEYPDFSRNLNWTLIERKIKDKFELKVEMDEVKEVMRNQIRQYFGNYPVTNEILDSSVDRMMADQEQFNRAYAECMSDKVFETIRDNVTLQDDPVSLEEFQELVKEAQAAKQHHHDHDHDHHHDHDHDHDHEEE
ncbi:MAG: hypothetical protein IPL46_11670 [Saprospiraceae bacterium]|nr:hypothetical protein [Saprospiraceae bacterium]